MIRLSEVDKVVIKKYGHLFLNTGGNDICELLERKGVNYFNNPVVAELQGSCASQLGLILKLMHNNLLPVDDEIRAAVQKEVNGGGNETL